MSLLGCVGEISGSVTKGPSFGRNLGGAHVVNQKGGQFHLSLDNLDHGSPSALGHIDDFRSSQIATPLEVILIPGINVDFGDTCVQEERGDIGVLHCHDKVGAESFQRHQEGSHIGTVVSEEAQILLLVGATW